MNEVRQAKEMTLSESEGEPTARAILDAVEKLLTDERTSATRHRYARVQARLDAYLESLGECLLTDAGVAMLEVERTIEPTAALFRVATGEDLLSALPGFVSLERPARLPVSDARAQLRFADETRRYIIRHGLVDAGMHVCAILGDRRRTAAGPQSTPVAWRGERMNVECGQDLSGVGPIVVLEAATGTHSNGKADRS